MPITMNPDAHYAGAVNYDRLLIGRVLTNRRIKHYQQLGRYDASVLKQPPARKKSRETALGLARRLLSL